MTDREGGRTSSLVLVLRGELIKPTQDLVRRGLESARSLQRMRQVRVMLVDDFPSADYIGLVRKDLERAASEIDIVCVKDRLEQGHYDDAVQAYDVMRPDLVVGGGQFDKCEVISRIRQRDPGAQCLLFDFSFAAADVRMAIDLGVRGLVGKPGWDEGPEGRFLTPPGIEGLRSAIHAVLADGMEGYFYFGQRPGELFMLHGGFEPGVALEELRGMRSVEEIRDTGVLFVWDGVTAPVRITDDLARQTAYFLDLSDPEIRRVDIDLIMKFEPWELGLPPGVLSDAEISELYLLPNLQMMTVGSEVILDRY